MQQVEESSTKLKVIYELDKPRLISLQINGFSINLRGHCCEFYRRW